MRRSPGFTLLEVIVALVLMGTVLVSSILAFARHHDQLQAADNRLEAVRIADRLVAEFASSQDGIPASARGAIAGKPNWYWVTSPVGTTMLADVPMLVLRFQIVETGTSSREWVSVDLVKAERTP